jgi:hypothetical protein
MGGPATFKDAMWDGVTLLSGYTAATVLVRDQLADGAKAGRWSEVLGLLAEHRRWVNSSRLGATAGTRPCIMPRGMASIPLWSIG